MRGELVVTIGIGVETIGTFGSLSAALFRREPLLTWREEERDIVQIAYRTPMYHYHGPERSVGKIFRSFIGGCP